MLLLRDCANDLCPVDGEILVVIEEKSLFQS